MVFLIYFDYFCEPLLGVYYYRLNVSDFESTLANTKVRDAFSMAIDWEFLVDEMMNGLFIVGEFFVFSSLTGYELMTKIFYDVRKVKEILVEVGYLNGEGFFRVILLYNIDENHKFVVEFVQDIWK